MIVPWIKEAWVPSYLLYIYIVIFYLTDSSKYLAPTSVCSGGDAQFCFDSVFQDCHMHTSFQKELLAQIRFLSLYQGFLWLQFRAAVLLVFSVSGLLQALNASLWTKKKKKIHICRCLQQYWLRGSQGGGREADKTVTSNVWSFPLVWVCHTVLSRFAQSLPLEYACFCF